MSIKKITQDNKVALIVGVIGLIGSIVSAIIGINTANTVNNIKTTVENNILQIEQMQQSIKVNNSEDIIDIEGENNQSGNNNLINQDNSTFNSHNVITNNTVLENENTDVETLMKYATIYYDAGNYEGVARIYANSKLSENSIALCNLGYMYANGIYFGKNINVAKDYYNKAIELGNQQAYNNWLAMSLNNFQADVAELIYYGYINHFEGAAIFIAQLYSNEPETDSEVMYKYLYDFCVLKTDNERESLLQALISWHYVGVKSFKKTPSASDIVKYVPIGTNDYIYEDKYISDRIYEVFEKKCYNVEVLNEKFIVLY